ncbi:MAG TPA: DNA-binding response regulator [Acidimicrobiaceae bacterium]|nr:DNA-binding response regulator [Acidimicrobiaceae bacterium]HCB37114.1 DNA-binding response regulator [Acidimicrobiaceae bacterium]
MSVKVLAVEDDERIRTALHLALADEGWDVTGAESAEDALDVVGELDADVILVDITLPGMNGFDLCRSIRRTSQVPIIIVTARDDTHDVVGGLEAGADDYLTKPFAPKELSARIRALLRRSRPPSDVDTPPVVIDDLSIHPDEGVVRKRGVEIPLTKTEFLLMCELADNVGKVLSREHLLEKVWALDYLGDGRLVDVHVRRLRMKVEDDPANPRYVATARGMGYKLRP